MCLACRPIGRQSRSSGQQFAPAGYSS